MFTSTRKIGFLFILIIVLPVLIFTVYEIGHFRENERMIWNIYKNQLEAILFSINQYSEDVISSWAGKIENSSGGNNTEKYKLPANVLDEMPSVKNLIQYDDNLQVIQVIQGDSNLVIEEQEIRNILLKNDTLLMKLKNYLQGGYRKILPISIESIRYQLIVFITRVNNNSIVNVLILNPEKFISNILDPKIQEIARGEFHIAAYRTGETKYIYSSDKVYTPGKIVENKPFWLINDYHIGIELKEKTIADLSGERANRNFIIICIMDAVLLFGAWLIYRNVKKQVVLSQLKSDFVSNVSHEIRTPLALVSMYIETLEMGRVKDENKVKEYYSIIMNETQRLSTMVNRILSFSQIEGKSRKYYFNSVDLNEIVNRSIQTFQFNLEHKGFHFSVYLNPDIPPVLADKDAIAESFINLIDNAIKYSDDKKNIAVRTGLDGKFVFIEVRDYGIGISKNDQKFIFDKFYRVTEKNLANRVKGSGLGLTIVKHIMEAHNGKIEVDSGLGIGTTIKLLFHSESVQTDS